ncbi:uncharacterized protein [Salminus brasiliensis]|uniref:uncharacterized protein isoform X3 n=1 Tax=Salminus brasiliensis TaxID=930266 RepID=UPI003B837CA7
MKHLKDFFFLLKLLPPLGWMYCGYWLLPVNEEKEQPEWRAAEDEGEQEHLKKHLSTFDITDLLTSFRSSPTPWSSELEELRSHWAALRLLDGAAATGELVDVENWHKKHSQAMNQHSWRRKKVMETLHTKSHGLAFPQCIPLLWTQEGCAHCLESRSA